MTAHDVLISIAINKGGGGYPEPEGTITINDNGEYDVKDKAGAIVEVLPDLTTKNISQNGNYSAQDENHDGYSSVSVSVPNSYAAGDEGKVVQSGALVSQSSESISQNGTYDTTTKNEVVVSIPADMKIISTTSSLSKSSFLSNIGSTTYGAGGKVSQADYDSVNVGDVIGLQGIVSELYNADGTNAQFLLVGPINQKKITAGNPRVSILSGTLYGIYNPALPSGSTSITQNGQGIDVAAYATADVNVQNVDHTTEDAIVQKTLSGSYENTRVTSVGNYVFYGCTGLTGVSLPNAETLGNSVFGGCTGLTSVSLPNVKTIGSNTFQNNDSLTGIVALPKLTEIPSTAFQNGMWKAIDIGSDVQSCGSLIAGNTSAYPRAYDGYIAIRANSVIPASGAIFSASSVWRPYILVPRALVDSYKSANNWSTYSAQFKALEDYTVDGTTTGDLDPTKL